MMRNLVAAAIVAAVVAGIISAVINAQNPSPAGLKCHLQCIKDSLDCLEDAPEVIIGDPGDPDYIDAALESFKEHNQYVRDCAESSADCIANCPQFEPQLE